MYLLRYMCESMVELFYTSKESNKQPIIKMISWENVPIVLENELAEILWRRTDVRTVIQIPPLRIVILNVFVGKQVKIFTKILGTILHNPVGGQMSGLCRRRICVDRIEIRWNGLDCGGRIVQFLLQGNDRHVWNRTKKKLEENVFLF